MKEPERWIVSRAEREGQWIRAALSEEPPDAALGRLASRLSSAGVAVGAIGATVTHVTHAGATVYAGLANGLSGGIAGTASVNTPVLFGATLLKAVLVGVGIGGGALLGGHWANAFLSSIPTSSANITDSAHVAVWDPAHDSTPQAPRVQVPERTHSIGTRRQENGRISSLAEKAADGTGQTQRAAHIESQAPLPRLDATPTEPTMPSALKKEAISVSTARDGKLASRATEAANSHRAGPGTLALEVAILARARQALKQGRASVALQELAALDDHGGHRLGPEAALLRVEALALSGQAESAATLARWLLASGVADAHRVRLLQFAKQRTSDE